MKISLSHWIKIWREPWRKTFWNAFYAFRRENGEQRRWENFTIQPDQVVFDIGGFEGNWAARAHETWQCHVHVFEPHPAFAAALEARFEGNDKITVHAFALGSSDGELSLSDEGDASSAVSGSTGEVTGKIVDVAKFMHHHNGNVALAKINIEGGEYDLLPAIIDSKIAPRFDCIQVQFHLYQQSDIAVRKAIQTELRRSHRLDWEYDFVWEQWSRQT